jgi:hypothetical protein
MKDQPTNKDLTLYFDCVPFSNFKDVNYLKLNKLHHKDNIKPNKRKSSTKNQYLRSCSFQESLNIDFVSYYQEYFKNLSIPFESCRSNVDNISLLGLKSLSGTINLLDKLIVPKRSYKGHYLEPKERELAKINRAKAICKCLLEKKNSFLLLKEKYKYDDRGNTIPSQNVLRVNLGCNSRICPHCSKKIKYKTTKELLEKANQFKNPRFLTLSFKNPTHLTREYFLNLNKQVNIFMKLLRRGYSLKRLNEIFKKIESDYNIKTKKTIVDYYLQNYKSKQIIKFGFDRYISIMELDYKKESSSWNVHFHIIYDGSLIPQSLAMHCLLTASKGVSRIVDIKQIKNNSFRNQSVKNIKYAVLYVTKYISKMYQCFNDSTLSEEYYLSTRQIRFVKAYGFDKPDILPSRYELFSEYLSYSFPDVDFWEKDLLYSQIIEYFKKHKDLLYFDLNLSVDENLSKNIKTQAYLDILELQNALPT